MTPLCATLDFDYLELCVGNARQAAQYFCTAFGFRPLAYAGPETGAGDRVTYVVAQGALRLACVADIRPGGAIAEHVRVHGDGVRTVALTVSDAREAFAQAVSRGARPIGEPSVSQDADGSVVTASIAAYGDTVHTFVERHAYRGAFLPGYARWVNAAHAVEPVGLLHIDHCVANVGWNEMETWAGFYARVFGFTQLISFDDADISTEFTALRSKVMSDVTHTVKFPINEPARGLKRSQIEEYLDYYGGPGVQHVAIATGDIVGTVRALRANGVELLATPGAYYDRLRERIGPIDEAIDTLRELGILVDRDDAGYMLQIFTKPLGDRPTLFFEIIQRKGSLSFGKGNFHALFVAIEAEQAKRGTL